MIFYYLSLLKYSSNTFLSIFSSLFLSLNWSIKELAFFMISRKGYEWAKANDLDLSKNGYPPKRGLEKISLL